jgi:hypothetical protein
VHLNINSTSITPCDHKKISILWHFLFKKKTKIKCENVDENENEVKMERL